MDFKALCFHEGPPRWLSLPAFPLWLFADGVCLIDPEYLKDRKGISTENPVLGAEGIETRAKATSTWDCSQVTAVMCCLELVMHQAVKAASFLSPRLPGARL